MRPAAALTTLTLGSLLAFSAMAAAEPDPTDLSPYLQPVEDAVVTGAEDTAAVLIEGAGILQDRFDGLRAIAEESANEVGADVNGCPLGGAVPLRVPRSTGEASPDAPAILGQADVWGDDLSAALNSEADCRSVQAASLGAPSVDPPAVPALPALPDFPAVPEASLPGAPELTIPGSPEVPALPALPEL